MSAAAFGAWLLLLALIAVMLAVAFDDDGGPMI
jgi:uncharacterized membrane protein